MEPPDEPEDVDTLLDAIDAELAEQLDEDLPEGAVPEAEAEGDEGA